jgi:hypothetical protein
MFRAMLCCLLVNIRIRLTLYSVKLRVVNLYCLEVNSCYTCSFMGEGK